MEERSSINRLIVAVIQEQDLETATRALAKFDLPVTHLPSTGGFLGRRNVTLLIGLNVEQEEIVMGALRRSCRRRVEYIATPLEGSPLPFPTPAPISIGGAIIFSFDVDRYIEFS